MLLQVPFNEQKRLATLKLLEVLDTGAEQEFDALTQLAAQICEVPISAISLIDADRQWFKSKIGLEINETARDISFCTHTILENEIFVVPDAVEDARFSDNPLVTGEPNVRFYAGAPLITDDGEAVGSLCVLDSVPRTLRPDQEKALRIIAGQVMRSLKLRKESADLARAKCEIEAREENYRIVTESASDAIITIDDDSLIVFANRAVEEIFGYDPQELIGREITVIVPQQMQAAHHAGISNYLQTGEKTFAWSGITLPALRRDGSEIQIEMSFGEYHHDTKRLFTAVIRDITERRVIEAKMRESEERYRFLTETVPQQIWTAQPDGKLDYVNERVLKFFGLSEAVGLIENSWLYAVHPDDAASAAASWRKSIETGEAYETEFRLRRSDGEYLWHLAQAVARRNENGEVIQWLGTNTNIHDRKTADETLRKSEEYLNLFRHANDAILIFELESETVVEVNDKACQLYGIERDDFLGKSIKSMSEDVRRGEDQLRRLHRSGTLHSFETVQFCADGTPISLSINSSIIEYRGKKVVLSINRDITESKLAEKALFESEERLRQSQKMEAIGTLTGGVAHDFNNLLTAILGNTQLALRKTERIDPTYNHLTEIENAGNRAVTLTRQLLAFSRRQHLDRRPINLNDSIPEIIKLLKRIIGADVEVCVQFDPNLATVFADSAQIEQIVMNLSVNARDAMPDGGRLNIETSNVVLDENYCCLHPYVQAGEYVRIKVSDSGTGMDKNTQARIFEPYFTTKEIGKGTGLGLSMVYGIVKQHEGYIELSSEPGYGTTFCVFLPVYKQAAVSPLVNENAPVLTGGTETILVAEDDKALQILAKNFLESLGYTVLLAADGEEAVNIFTAHRQQINMLLFDMVMPRAGGVEAYRRIQEIEGGDVPLIFMTGYNSEIVQNKYPNSGNPVEVLPAAIIQKPYTIEAIGFKVREILDNRAA